MIQGGDFLKVRSLPVIRRLPLLNCGICAQLHAGGAVAPALADRHEPGLLTTDECHRVTRNLQGDGTGAISIYGTRYADENFIGRHTGPGLLSSVGSLHSSSASPVQAGCTVSHACCEPALQSPQRRIPQ